MLKITILFVATIIGVSAIAPPTTGEDIYKTKCAMCHNGKVAEAPRFEALQMLTSKAIIKSLETGVMKTQGSTLSAKERKMVAAFISKQKDKQQNIVAGTCAASPKEEKNAQTLVSNWGNGLTNSRFINSENVGINEENVSKLTLKWVFAFPDATRARVQPTIAGNTLYTANQNGLVYALDRQTGCVQWTYQAEDEVRSSIVIGSDKKGMANRLYFSDFKANVYALDIQKKKLLWKHKMDSHPLATITGTLLLHEGRLYVPLSSTEIVAAYNPKYPCCNFRGSVAALNALDGSFIWKTYTVDEPKPQAINSAGVQNYGPSGAPVWSSPTIDVKRKCLYIGTGENYSHPTSLTSDAIIAMSLETGQILWSKQTQSRDAWNAGCIQAGSANCPENHGPDFDFGAPPILIQRNNMPDVLLAGQKSGMVYAFNPDSKGDIIWQQRVGRGGIMGGIHWGMASDGQTLYVPINDREAWEADKDKPAFPGLHAVDIDNGKILWSAIEKNRCKGDEKWNCGTGLSAAITLIKGVVFGGALDGILHAYSTKDGHVLWEYNTNRDFEAINGVKAFGGAIDSGGAIIVENQLFINSGYAKFGEKAGNVLLCFEVKNKPLNEK
jgi:polyvinyl alcohol dehydrogenase (cytochrome)